MPNTITSEDPVSQKAVVARTYGDMKVYGLKIITQDDDLRLLLHLKNYDSKSSEVEPNGKGYRLKMNLSEELTLSPKLQKAWDDFIDILAENYEHARVDEKIKKSNPRDDISALVSKRDSALASMRAPLA